MSGRVILIVEPNPGILIVGRNVLARAGFDVIAVSTVEEGLQEAKRRPLDTVMLDGKHSEPEVLLAFARSRSQGVPIILTVQKGRDVITIEALEAGGWSGLVEISDVLEKPFAPDRLLAAVEKAVSRFNERTDPHLSIDVEDFFRPENDEVGEHERTERYQPLSTLLDGEGERTDSHELFRPSRIISAETTTLSRTARLLTRIRDALKDRRIKLDERQLAVIVDACESVMDDETIFERMDYRPGDLALAGFIEQLPLDHVLQLAASVAPPARCRLEHDDQAIEILFKNGQVVFARQEKMPEGFMLGRFLVAAGAINQRDVDRTINTRREVHEWLGQRLVSAGYIGPEDLQEALRRQVEELVYEAVRWNKGRFVVYSNEPLPAEAEAARLSLPVPHLLLEGMRRLDEWRRIATEVGGLRSVIDRLEPPEAPGVIDMLRPDERMVLEQIDGRRTVEDLVRSVRRPTFEVVKALSNLRGQRLVTVVSTEALA
jgi:DNA-binding response OmpR family regulator